MKIYGNAQKLAVSCLNLVLPWIHVDKDSSGEKNKNKNNNFAHCILAMMLKCVSKSLVSEERWVSCSVCYFLLRHNIYSWGYFGFWSSFLCPILQPHIASTISKHQPCGAVRGLPQIPQPFPRCSLKSESCCKAFQLGLTGIFPTEKLLLSTLPSSSASIASAGSCGSGCTHQPQPDSARTTMAQKSLQLHPKAHSSLTPPCRYYSSHSDWCGGEGESVVFFKKKIILF